MVDYQKDLNAEQRKIVENGEGPVLVLAGAGSGKTRVITYRVAYLIEKKGVSPDNILLVTFTNKAAKEMSQRVSQLLGQELKGLWRGTFHHIANRFLRKYSSLIGYQPYFTILDREDSLLFFKQCYEEIVTERGKYFPKPNLLASYLSLNRNRDVSLKDYLLSEFSYLTEKEFSLASQIQKRYAEKKKEAQVMDFDDLLIYFRDLLRQEKIGSRIASQFHYILVDEFQDTNKIQAEIIKILASAHKNILAVGDDAQSIYSFRAAEVKNILNFPQEFSGAKIFRLETNYRSRQPILDLANASISYNRQGFKKELQSARGQGKPPILFMAKNNQDQARLVVRKIKEELGKNKEAKIGVLFRSAFQALELELELNRQGMPYILRGGLRFFDQKHIKDMLACLRIKANPQDEVAWQRLLLLGDYIGPKAAHKIFTLFQEKGESIFQDNSFSLPSRAASSWKKWQTILADLFSQEKPPASQLLTFFNQFYSTYLRLHFDDYADRQDDCQQFIAFAQSYQDLDSLLSDVLLAENFTLADKKDNPLILTTIHQAKGLEWDIVFLIGLVDGQFPHRKVYDNPKEIEEERRLFYVAVTRAKEKLFLFFPAYNNQSNSLNQASCFLEETENFFLKEELNDFISY